MTLKLVATTYEYKEFTFEICMSFSTPYTWEVYLISYPEGWEYDQSFDVDIQCINAYSNTEALDATTAIIDTYYESEKTL